MLSRSARSKPNVTPPPPGLPLTSRSWAMRRHSDTWRTMRLADTGRWLSGGTPNTSFPAYWGGDIPWISASSLKDFDIAHSNRRVSQLGASSGTRIVPPNTTLFVVRGMSLKNEFRVGVTRREVAFGQDCKAIIPRPGVDARFLAYSLAANADRVLAMVDEAGHGTGRLPTDQLAALKIGVPEPAEQRRIVDILDSLDGSIRSTERLIVKLERRKEGILQELVERVAAAATPRFSTVEQEFDVKPGITLGVHRRPRRRATPYLRVANVQRGRVDFDDLAFMEATKDDLLTYSLRTGDLLVVEGHASPSEIGRCAVIRQDPGALVYQNHLFRLRPKRLSSEYAHLWLNSGHTRSYWRRMCATSSGLYTINSRQLRALPVRMPEPREQDRIVGLARSHDKMVDCERAQLEKLRKLRHGLMEDLLMGWVRVPMEGA
ncbi:restriction endonuclease subunit S [Micromonospora sp. NPDC005257]|uniref:restriction endonuclease subunit S n=1 Tax=Micromonospora sp. NPDC005257 TaxID=3364230 RepID=UPI0036A87B9C